MVVKKLLQRGNGRKGILHLSWMFLFALLIVISGCTGEKASTNENPEENSGEVVAHIDAASTDAVTYDDNVKDIIANNCLTCHGDQSPTMAEFNVDPDKYAAIMKGPRLDSYENLLVVVNGEEAGALMRRLDDGTNRDDGQPGNMNHNLGATAEERQNNLETLKEWVGNWTLKRANELTDEDRAQFKVLKNKESYSTKQENATAIVTYEAQVKEIIANNCLTCHGGDLSPTMAEFNKDPDKYSAMMKGPRLEGYENLLVVVNGEEAGALMRRLDDGTNREDGQPGNMNHNLGATDDERKQNLETLKQWVGNWTLKRANELTDEDRAQFKVLEK